MVIPETHKRPLKHDILLNLSKCNDYTCTLTESTEAICSSFYKSWSTAWVWEKKILKRLESPPGFWKCVLEGENTQVPCHILWWNIRRLDHILYAMPQCPSFLIYCQLSAEYIYWSTGFLSKLCQLWACYIHCSWPSSSLVNRNSFFSPLRLVGFRDL